MQDKYRSRPVSKGNIFFRRLATTICCDTFLDILNRWLSNFNRSLMLTPRIFREEFMWMMVFSHLKCQFVSSFAHDNGFIFCLVSFEIIQIVPFIYQQKIWVDWSFHLDPLTVGTGYLYVTNLDCLVWRICSLTVTAPFFTSFMIMRLHYCHRMTWRRFCKWVGNQYFVHCAF